MTNPVPAPIANNQPLTANRANATLCTGPRTAAGKQRSCQNALTHGLTPASQKIDALIVRDAKDPRGEGTRFVPCLKAAVSPKKRVLRYVFPICDGACHPRAVAVKPRSKGADGFQKCEISGFELSGVFHISLRLAQPGRSGPTWVKRSSVLSPFHGVR